MVSSGSKGELGLSCSMHAWCQAPATTHQHAMVCSGSNGQLDLCCSLLTALACIGLAQRVSWACLAQCMLSAEHQQLHIRVQWSPLAQTLSSACLTQCMLSAEHQQAHQNAMVTSGSNSQLSSSCILLVHACMRDTTGANRHASTCRAMEFLVALLLRLCTDPQTSLSTAASEVYTATIYRYHTWYTSAAFTVALKVRYTCTAAESSDLYIQVFSYVSLCCFARLWDTSSHQPGWLATCILLSCLRHSE